MNVKRAKLIIRNLAILLLFGFSGCGMTAIEATHCAYNHLRGDLLGIVPYHVEQVLPTAVNVIKELDGYDLGEQQSNFLNAFVIAYDEDSRKVQIDLSRTEDNQTKIQIRIGVIGDKLKSTMIFNQIVNQLSNEDSLNQSYSKMGKG